MYSVDENQFSSDENSAQQKKYFCFCQKLFATYPGIYQHLKSKHANLFPIYKKMKIQKMLKKSRDSRGTYSYKLLKLSEDPIHPGNPVQKNKKTNSCLHPKNNQELVDQPQNAQIVDNQRTSVKASSNQSQVNKIDIQYPEQQIQSKNSGVLQEVQKEFSGPFSNSPAEMASYSSPFPHCMPHLFPHYYSMITNSWLTIKAFLLRFLLQSPEFNRDQTKSYLYDLMVFIDKNRHLTKDPRIEGRLFLSYCDQFDPQYIGPLLNQFVQNLESALRQLNEQFKEQQVYNKKIQIYCVKAFGDWLQQAGLLRSQTHLQSQSNPNQPLELKPQEKAAVE